jgi:hypothetical protein
MPTLLATAILQLACCALGKADPAAVTAPDEATPPALEGEDLHTWLRGLNAESFTQFTVDFAEAHPGMRDELLDRVEAENCKVNWHIDPTPFFGRIIDAVGEVYRRLYPE